MNKLKSIARRIMTQRGLLPDFSPAVVAETRSIAAAPAARGPAVRDLRELLWASIDNDMARDLDQLSVSESLADGAVKILVAVADVDAVVRRHSAIDGHAEANTTSVYTAAAMFPMLPEKLSTDLTSLKEGEERLAIVIEMVVGAEGSVLQSDIYRATVLNRAKLAYDSVAAWLEGTGAVPPPVAAVPGLDAQLHTQDRAARAMRGLRFQHGALSLLTPRTEAVFIGGELSELRSGEPNRAQELIEDFMVAANGATASYLERKGFPSLRRVLRSPERWARIVTLAKALGKRLPTEPSSEALARFLAQRRLEDPLRFPELSLSVLKLLGRGEYVLELPSQRTQAHFGLAASGYTHSTAPNRRFPDLVTQRLLKAAISAGPIPYTHGELHALARHCTAQETNAAKVERQVSKSAAAQLLAARIGEQFEGLVTGASGKGTWVRVRYPAVEGKLVRGFHGLDVGDRVKVELVHTDVDRGFIDFALTRAK